ncbi:hypothetical protein GJV85_05040 [Sulfurimonas aquatica]|uniref:Transformation system protein n=1 Tax=Sulfurimonas aquatica TaxID=2672570 RepID=A0A975GC95_9BACT|nr:hypothetical protein [Sulfurimonas aquatica]QSZ41496.1 hypothetical protein GJV85_05040 [Sulfurimonas aquatica]
MLNIIELEKRWLHYKIKSFIPHITIFVSLTIISSILYIFVIDPKEKIDTKITSSTKEEITKIELPVIEKELPPMVKKEEVIEQVNAPLNKKTVQLEPSLNFMKKMQSSIQPYNNYNKSTPTYDTPTETRKVVTVAPKQEEKSIKEIVPDKKVDTKITPKVKTSTIDKPTEEEPKHINIQKRNTQNDINDIIRRFKKNNNPALSLFVAKKYYELGNYNQAYNYSLITNKINKDIEASWIIFSKSLFKMGKKDMATKTLQEYIKSSQSSSARILLDDIHSGKFK